MARLIRFEDAGAKLTEDCSNKFCPTCTYVGVDTFVDTPFGKRIKLASGKYINTNSYQDFIQQTGVFTISWKMNMTTYATNFQRLLWGLDSVPTANGWRVQLAGTALNMYIGNNGAQIMNNNLGTFVAGTDYTISLVGSGTNVTWYINGVLIGTVGMTTANLGGTQSLDTPTTIGSNSSSITNGWVSDVIIDNRAWTSQEVTNFHENKVFDYSRIIFKDYNISGDLTYAPFDDTTKTNIKNNLKSDGSTSLGLTQIQINDFIKQNQAENL